MSEAESVYPTKAGPDGTERRRVVEECRAMAEWATGRGLLPAQWAVDVALTARGGEAEFDRPDESRRSVVAADRHLSEVVHPARPASIRRLAEERRAHPGLAFFGPLPIVRRLIAAAAAFLAAFVLFAASPKVRESTTPTTTTLSTPQPLPGATSP